MIWFWEHGLKAKDWNLHMTILGKILLWVAALVGTFGAIIVLLLFAFYLATGRGSRWEE